MPELADVEVYRRYLNATALHQRIAGTHAESDEILFQARVHPRQNLSRLDEAALEALYRNLHQMFDAAIEALWRQGQTHPGRHRMLVGSETPGRQYRPGGQD